MISSATNSEISSVHGHQPQHPDEREEQQRVVLAALAPGGAQIGRREQYREHSDAEHEDLEEQRQFVGDESAAQVAATAALRRRADQERRRQGRPEAEQRERQIGPVLALGRERLRQQHDERRHGHDQGGKRRPQVEGGHGRGASTEDTAACATSEPALPIATCCRSAATLGSMVRVKSGLATPIKNARNTSGRITASSRATGREGPRSSGS